MVLYEIRSKKGFSLAKIVIIGAGPAGLISGNYLVRDGHKVVVYEKNEKIISSPCGEAISVNTVHKLEEDTGFNSKPFVSKEVKGLKLFFPENNFVFMYKKGFVFDRDKWMNGLAKHFEKQGGKIFFGREIKNTKKLKFDYLVGADGPNSNIRRAIGGKVYMEIGTQYKIKADSQNRDFVEFYLDREVNKYYSWIFPKKNYLNVGSVGPFNEIDRLVAKYRIEGEIFKKQAAPVPMNGTKCQEKNVFLIGDAAGMTNSFSGGGIAPIVYASTILRECIKQGKIQEYEKKIKEHNAFSKNFYHAKKMIRGLTQKKLVKIGKLAHNKDLLKLPLTTKLKVIKHPEIISDLLIMVRAFEKGIEYAW